MSRIAVVPARSGSQGIKDKNLRKLAGIELIQYAISAALRDSVFSEVILNSDSDEYRTWSEKNGISFFLRSKKLGSNEANISDVITELVDVRGIEADWIYLFQPTNPFVIARHLKDLMELEVTNAPGLQTVCEVSHTNHAWNQRIVNEKGLLTFIDFERRSEAYRKQDKPKTYKFGNLLATRVPEFKKTGSVWQKESAFSVIPTGYDLDIDSERDLQIGEALISGGIVCLDTVSDQLRD